MMNCMYGNSIRKLKKNNKNKYKNLEETKKVYGDQVLKHNDKRVTIKLNFKEHYYYPQYAKTLLDKYHEKMKKISEIVNVLYCNIDSILVTECDYNKLNELGYIGYDLGQFKIEHIFKEFVIVSPSKWVAITENDVEIKSRKDLNMSYEEMINNI